MFLANSRITIMRGTYQDDMDDTHDSTRPVAVDVPASLVEMTSTTTSPETGRSFDVMYVEGYVRPNVDIQDGDRVLDQRTEIVYTVDAISQSGVFMRADKRLKMRILDA